MDSEGQDKTGPSATATVQPSNGHRQPDHGEQLAAPSFEKDAAAAIAPDHAIVLDKAVARRVQRKIDWFLIPIMWVGYGLVYYDKVPLALRTISDLADILKRPS